MIIIIHWVGYVYIAPVEGEEWFIEASFECMTFQPPNEFSLRKEDIDHMIMWERLVVLGFVGGYI